MSVGSWRVYPIFDNTVSKIVDTPDLVYFVSSNYLFSYNKTDEEVYAYSITNKLNDNVVTNIFYNSDNKYLLIAYDNGNIDLLYDDGSVVNLADIKDAVLTSSKTINDAFFVNNRIYVATAFGLVVFNDQKYEVVESGIYNKSIGYVKVMGDNVVLYYDSVLYTLNVGDRINSFDNFSYLFGTSVSGMEVLNDTQAVYKNGTNLRLITFDLEKLTNTYKVLSFSGVKGIFRSKNGIGAYKSDSFAMIDQQGNMTTTDLPDAVQGQMIASWEGESSIWAGDENGLANYSIKDGGLTVLHDKFKPDVLTVKHNIFYISSDPDGKIYFSNTSQSLDQHFASKIESHVNTLKDGVIEDVTAYNADYSYYANPIIKSNQDARFIQDPYKLVVDPTNPDNYYLGSFWEGIYKISGGKQIAKYDLTNSSLVENYGCRTPDLAFDPDNNLWVVQGVPSGAAALHFVPAAALAKSTTTADDWTPIKLGDYDGNKDARMIICKKSTMIFVVDGTHRGNSNDLFLAYDTNGSYDNLSDDVYLFWNGFTDQDGNSFEPERFTALAEDNNGKIWVGTTSGIVEISNPKNALSSGLTVNRIKVPRNDGTSYADYLLDGIWVTSITVDASNRKWIGTQGDGLYLVSSDGSEILQHYLSSNSYLPGDWIYAVFCDPNSNLVFISTEYGLVEYSSDSSPAESDYSAILAYPNPVRPGYTGGVTITGLMENSLVKITDSAGNLFYSATSESGMVTWDGRNSDGQRVKSGVYFVFASQSDDEGSSGAVTKILVIN